MLSIQQAAELLGYSPSGIRKLVRRRAIRYFQVRKHSPIKFKREWLDEFIEAHSVEPSTAPVVPAQRRQRTPSVLDSFLNSPERRKRIARARRAGFAFPEWVSDAEIDRELERKQKSRQTKQKVAKGQSG